MEDQLYPAPRYQALQKVHTPQGYPSEIHFHQNFLDPRTSWLKPNHHPSKNPQHPVSMRLSRPRHHPSAVQHHPNPFQAPCLVPLSKTIMRLTAPHVLPSWSQHPLCFPPAICLMSVLETSLILSVPHNYPSRTRQTSTPLQTLCMGTVLKALLKHGFRDHPLESRPLPGPPRAPRQVPVLTGLLAASGRRDKRTPGEM